MWLHKLLRDFNIYEIAGYYPPAFLLIVVYAWKYGTVLYIQRQNLTEWKIFLEKVSMEIAIR